MVAVNGLGQTTIPRRPLEGDEMYGQLIELSEKQHQAASTQVCHEDVLPRGHCAVQADIIIAVPFKVVFTIFNEYPVSRPLQVTFAEKPCCVTV